MLAIYACDPKDSKGRLYPEKPTPYRNEFQRDRDRIIHSNAFRRLQYKTQVFVNHEGDHYRNRLTHSIEVSSVARSIARTLDLSDDLAESVALAHDLGHTPFGHAGEAALDECMREHGGFSHNAHSLKLLTKLEQRYAAYDGLNLTWEVLEGIVKHNGPLIDNISGYITEYNNTHDLGLSTYASAEAQLASLSDDIAYICHDLEDSVRAKIITIKDLQELDFIAPYIHQVARNFPDLPTSSLIYEVVRELTHRLINGLLEQTRINLAKQKINSAEEVKLLGYQLIDFTPQVQEEIREVKDFLFRKVYRHYRVTSVTYRCQKIVKELFKLYTENYNFLPKHWQDKIDNNDKKTIANVVADYIAGMTDRFAINEFQSFYNLTFNKI